MSTRERAGRYARAGARWARLLAAGRPDPGVRVFYGHDRVPGPGEPVAGGTAKFQRLATRFPNHPTDFSLLYIGSTWIPRDFRPLLRLARRRDIPLLLNQNGVGYPGWAGDGTEAFNRPLRTLLGEAAHVLYQSEFCKRAADEWIGSPQGTWEVLHNAVDVHHFTPAERPPEGGPVLLLGGDQYQAYRLELGLETLAELVPRHPDARLLVTGRLVTPIEPLVDRLGLEGRVHVLGRYAQSEAPAIFRRAHLLLHTKVNDPCPSLVVEAMASGLPVVYAKSGGVPELVGDEAGVGVPHPDARLLVTGRLVTPIEPLVDRFGLEGRVQVLGRYAQSEAPAIFRRAHLLLHTKVNDPCPSLVVEAMASGLPVVYAKSGGVPELVGDDAGIGVPHPDGFERDEPPAPDELADAVTRVLEALPGYAEAARRRAVERFPLEAWLDRHAAVFERFAPR